MIFISHSSKDKFFVEKIINLFDEFYIPYWVNTQQVEYIDNPRRKINNGLERATHFLLIWSKNAQDS
ncbi:MAG: toll/interleukin-1 receptor domain-containing protein [Candidatus Nitrosocosmicus sp.]